MSDNLIEDNENSRNSTLICPSCRISFISERPRSMCPFCGSFYDSDAEGNYILRGRNASITESIDGENSFRLPRIQRPSVFRFPGFGPFLTDSVSLINSLMSSILMRANDEDSNIYFQLPSLVREDIRTNREGSSSMYYRRDGLTSPLRYDPEYSTKQLTLPINVGEDSSDHCDYSLDSQDCRSMYHRESYPNRFMSLTDFRTLVQDSYENEDFTRLHALYERTFSSLVELNALFKEDSDADGAKLHDPELKMDLIYAMYDEMDRLPSFITKAVLRGIISSLSSHPRLKSKDEARAIYMLLQIPLFSYQSSYNVLAYLLKGTVNMHGGDHQLLIHWFAKSEPERLRKLVKRLHQFVSIREFPPGNGHKLPSISKSRWWIPCATRVLALLNSANNKGNLVQYTEFYNSALDHINLIAEYHRWQNPSKHNKFSYCQFPFILSIVAKKTIFQKDSEQQMIVNARKSLLNRAIYQQIPDIDVFFLNLNVRRSHLVSDSLHEIARKQSDLKKKLKVTFVGEPGLDMGGLTKEWFLLLIRKIFSEEHGMFVYHSKARCYWFSTSNEGNLKEYNLIGVLMGLAVYNSIILDLHFPKACYKKLLSPPVVPHDSSNCQVGIAKLTMAHFAEVMPDVAIGLKELLAYEGNVEEDFCMTFQVSIEEFGKMKTHVLKVGGEDISVTEENREEYVQLYMDLILNRAIHLSFEAFYLGFHSVCASNAIIMLRPEEVEILVCGSPTIDMEELRKVTLYDGFHEDEPIIKDFWSIIKSFSPDLQRQFLRFVTGSDRVPVGGMSEMIFKISAINHNTEMLPISHTCFNQLVLPRYPEKSILREKLVIAISNAEGFGLE
ncbi:putative E3 ubiquitin-protein ligase HECTD2 isoform X3 [Brevipalpus obovatus]|uniref:putative E3 ubiquitin-protein ligase HECTD2 isoform X3 n=1 Tax=Brevipalpus obovatus TaxID=246614 RepID=UPI003D9F810C